MVLLVEPNEADRFKIRCDLESAGHVVLEAPTEQFLRIASEQPVSIAVIDITPLKHRLHLVGIMELRRRRPQLPIIALCGGPDAVALLGIATHAGAAVTRRIPVTREELLQATTQCLTAAKKIDLSS